MKFFKNHKRSGVTLLEVLFATAILSFVGIGVLGLQQALLRTTSEASSLLLHMRLLNNFAIETRKEILEKKEPAPKKAAQETDAELTYKEKKPPKTGLFKDLKDVVITTFGASWTDVVGKREEQLVYLDYKPEEEEAS